MSYTPIPTVHPTVQVGDEIRCLKNTAQYGPNDIIAVSVATLAYFRKALDGRSFEMWQKSS